MFVPDTEPMIMGIVNLTPDSLYGPPHKTLEDTLARCSRMIDEGASIIDVGGESTRPGAKPVSEAEELQRVLPLIGALRAQSEILISVDTYKSRVAQECLRHGADIVNDVSGGLYDPAILEVCAAEKAPIVLVHNRYDQTPHAKKKPSCYENIVEEVGQELQLLAELAQKRGCGEILLDPGLGFAKNAAHNLALLTHLERLKSLGLPLLIGASNKGFVRAGVSGEEPGAAGDSSDSDPFLGANLAVCSLAVFGGAKVIRAHEVKQHYQAASMAYRLRRAAAERPENGGRREDER